MNKSRRIVRVGMSFPLLLDIMGRGYRTGGEIECTEGLPPDSEYVSAYTDDRTGTLYMVFQHPSFESIEVGGLIPEVCIVHKKIYHGPLEEYNG